jgi:hypothetical protein
VWSREVDQGGREVKSKPANTPRSSSSSQPPFGAPKGPPHSHHSLAYAPHTKSSISYLHVIFVYISPCTSEKVLPNMDDPDVDHELIAFMRESLGISNKAQDIVTSDTGKADRFLFLSFFFICRRVFGCTAESAVIIAFIFTRQPHKDALATLLTTA